MLRYNVLTSAIFSHRTPAGLGPLIPDYAYVAEALQPRFQLDASPMWAITFDAAFFFEQYGVQHDRHDSSWLCNRITLSSQAILFSFKDARCYSLARTKAIKTGDLSLVLLLSKLLLGVPLNPLLPPLRALVNILSSAVDGIESVYEKNGTTFPDVNAPYTLSPLEHNPQVMSLTAQLMGAAYQLMIAVGTPTEAHREHYHDVHLPDVHDAFPEIRSGDEYR